MSSMDSLLKLSGRKNAAKLMRAEALYLSSKDMKSVPDAIEQLTNLKELRIDYNQLTKFPTVLLNMTQLTSLNISGNLFTSLPEGITKLSKLSVLTIADINGLIAIKSGPIGISTLPCFKTNQDLQRLDRYEASPTTSGSKASAKIKVPKRIHLRIRGINTNVHHLLEERLRQTIAPILCPNKAEIHESSELVSKNGVLCLLCLKLLNHPCVLACDHVFCTSCVEDWIHGSVLHPPFACPICHEPSMKSEKVTEDMISKAKFFKDMSDTVEKAIMNTSHQKCLKRACNEKATDYCKKCGFYCSDHLKAHNEAHDHEELLSQVDPADLPTAEKLKCKTHPSYEIKYYCQDCLEKPFKCAECHAEDHKPEENPHRYIQYRGSDADCFEEILKTELDEITEMIKKTKSMQSKIDNEKTEFYRAYEQTKSQTVEFVKSLEILVTRLKENLHMQLDNLEKECNREIGILSSELRADEMRLQLSQKLILDTIENFKVMQPDQIKNVFCLSKEMRNSPEKKIDLKPMRVSERLPREILEQLESFNMQLLIGASPEKSSELPASSDLNETFDQSQNLAFDQTSGNYFGISEKGSEIVVVDQNKRVVQKTAPCFLIEGGLHNLQGISVSKAGILAVADSFANAVLLYDAKTMRVGMVLHEYGVGRELLFKSPTDLAFDSQGRLFVVDPGSKSIIVFSKDFAFSHRIEVAHIGDSQVENVPQMIEISTEDFIFIYCSGTNCILAFDKDSNFIPPENCWPITVSSV
eukprot:TRINITY_DN9790_c0_g1_i2.p1 TRINITY_DN9790_c0_g1~~TRINITY_DN9790_c0_g1_i2.p1  ORF type:complete len:755 (-),score=140.20 TRINITY_DN9790_c0_g1_i2:146-2410(-)